MARNAAKIFGSEGEKNSMEMTRKWFEKRDLRWLKDPESCRDINEKIPGKISIGADSQRLASKFAFAFIGGLRGGLSYLGPTCDLCHSGGSHPSQSIG